MNILKKPDLYLSYRISCQCCCYFLALEEGSKTSYRNVGVVKIGLVNK